ncbi:hypothetical protein MPSI1_003335 [Malassezia psittaci]|uniref:YMC020W-like alpha/beta hydrolase domain-containing protein n=1 Tax=Malassezia psittaci TaxID=1821823 RepID=A0AAF0F997_9BASI|nr:hypothetical protein MPSI1_003335 [Malassezia psittaci]
MTKRKSLPRTEGENPEAVTPWTSWIPWRAERSEASETSASPTNESSEEPGPIPDINPSPDEVQSGTEVPSTTPPSLRTIRARMLTKPIPALARSSQTKPSTGSDPAKQNDKRPPSLVLPTLDEILSRPPRVWAPRPGLWTRTMGAMNAYLFPRTARDESHQSTPSGDFSRQFESGSNVPHLHAEHERAMPRAYSALGKDPDRRRHLYAGVRRVVVIGVHGWFAQSIFKSVIGAPVGTSQRFASMMAASVRHQFQEAGFPLEEDSVTILAPQHDGRVDERTERFFEEIVQNPKSLQAIQEADALLIASHSQGAVVATLLLDRLIEEALLDPERTRTCVLSMCGVYQGPFVHLQKSLASSYINYFETGAARELFEFQASDSAVSVQHRDAYERILQNGVKMVHIGSLDDNVVPMYSALYSSVAHPSILRAVYIDGMAFPETDFLIRLVLLCVAVRNNGFHDYNLLTLLSASVAGSLYGGLGHSLIYDEPNVYDFATRYLFDTQSPARTGATNIPLTAARHSAQRWNPYDLPWALRGLLDDKTIEMFFKEDIQEVIKDYAHWNPTSKPLRDLRWRLAPVRTLTIPDQTEPQAPTEHSRGMSKL